MSQSGSIKGATSILSRRSEIERRRRFSRLISARHAIVRSATKSISTRVTQRASFGGVAGSCCRNKVHVRGLYCASAGKPARCVVEAAPDVGGRPSCQLIACKSTDRDFHRCNSPARSVALRTISRRTSSPFCQNRGSAMFAPTRASSASGVAFDPDSSSSR